MGKIITGINGPVQGKVGTVIGSTWKGIPYIKSLHRKRKGKRISAEEKNNRTAFAAAQYWLKPVLDFVRQGFKGYTATVEGFVAAKSWLLKNAVEKTGTGIVINPSLVRVSFGDLPLPDGISIRKTADQQLQFSWDATMSDKRYQYDQAMLLAYDIEKNEAEMKLTGQFRYMGLDVLQISSDRVYHVYIAFIAADRSRQSNSLYLGKIEN